MDSYNVYDYNPQADERTSHVSYSLSGLMTKVYLWMTLALTMTGLTAFYVAGNEALLFSIIGNQAVFWGLMIAELALVWIFSARIQSLSFPVAGIIFAAYSVLNGATLSVIMLAYTMESIATTFFVTAGTFGAMALLGLTIKKDLSSMGRLLTMTLIGLIIASVVNMFVASSALDWALTYVGILLFCGLTAYDTQKIKQMLAECQSMGNVNIMKIALLGSLSLYLDLVNLFLYLLRIFGTRRS